MIFAKNFKKKQVENLSVYRFDPLLGFWGKPNVKRTITQDMNPGVEIEINHNEEGMRDIPFTLKDSQGTILCIGGSHSWGGGVAQELRYSDRLAQRSGRQVINLGHCSLGIDQIAIIILKRIKKFNPQIIIMEQYPWAVVRILINYVNGYVKPAFYLDSQGQLKLKKVPRLARVPLFRRMIGSFYAYRKELREFQGGIDLGAGYDPLNDPLFCYWKVPYYNYVYALLEEIILTMRDYCCENDIKLIFALGAISQQFAGPSKSCLIDYDLPRKRLKNILEKLGIAYLDMTDSLLKEHSQSDPVIFHDGHINAKGHNVFATALQKDLENRGWI